MPSPSPEVPSHVGIIMDGNGRWARERGLSRTSGHKEGLETAKRIVAYVSDSGVNTLSLFVFSTENWKRAEEEVSFLMGLIMNHLRKQYGFYKKRRLRVTHSGDMEKLPTNVRNEILLVEDDTRDFTGMRVNLLINYGGRDEIIRAVQRFGRSGGNVQNIKENDIRNNLDHPEIADLDLLIRTGGESRISNFLIWEAAYAELFFSRTYWPDWTSANVDEAFAHYNRCQRRFGGIPG